MLGLHIISRADLHTLYLSLGTKTRSYNRQLGETGAGIKSAEEVDFTRKNHFTNLVGESYEP